MTCELINLINGSNFKHFFDNTFNIMSHQKHNKVHLYKVNEYFAGNIKPTAIRIMFK